MNTRRDRNAIEQIEWMRNLLAFLLVGAFIGTLPALFMVAIPEQNKDIITYMVGQLSGMALTALGFYFVNKVGSDALDAKRADNTGKLADAVVAAAGGPLIANPDIPADAVAAADQVAEAASNEAEAIAVKAEGTKP